jgi:hypothetical protein
MALYVPTNARNWVYPALHRIVWTDELNECMVIIAITETHVGFAHLDSHNYTLNRDAPKGIIVGTMYSDDCMRSHILSARVYTNPPSPDIITKKLLPT